VVLDDIQVGEDYAVAKWWVWGGKPVGNARATVLEIQPGRWCDCWSCQSWTEAAPRRDAPVRVRFHDADTIPRPVWVTAGLVQHLWAVEEEFRARDHAAREYTRCVDRAYEQAEDLYTALKAVHKGTATPEQIAEVLRRIESDELEEGIA
jgi:hypothetical protein